MNLTKKMLLGSALAYSLSIIQVQAQIEDKRGIVEKGAELVKVQDGFSFTEGPAVNRFGDVFFTDQPNNKIYKWNAISNEVSLFKDEAGRSNGMYFMLDGNLLTCADEDNQLWSIDSDGDVQILISAFYVLSAYQSYAERCYIWGENVLHKWVLRLIHAVLFLFDLIEPDDHVTFEIDRQ